MKKVLVYLFLVLVAMVLAGLYGMIHNQISYTVSEEYFTKFKFNQFGLDGCPWPNRVKAAAVGFLASWWMGVPIGLVVGTFGFVHPSARRMLTVTLWSFAVVIGFTLLFGLGGLGYGWIQTRRVNIADYQGWYIPDGLVDVRRFLCAGYMHNSSYLGGLLAIFVAAIFHIVIVIKTRKRTA